MILYFHARGGQHIFRKMLLGLLPQAHPHPEAIEALEVRGQAPLEPSGAEMLCPRCHPLLKGAALGPTIAWSIASPERYASQPLCSLRMRSNLDAVHCYSRTPLEVFG
jgi:hypothetical protein